jgi:hypothetical protein
MTAGTDGSTGTPVLPPMVPPVGAGLDRLMECPPLADPPLVEEAVSTVSERRRVFWIIEVVLVGSFLLTHLGMGVWDWWRNGDRVTGTIVEIDRDGQGHIMSMTIMDPATERNVEVQGPWAPHEVGDPATAVVHPADATEVRTSGELIVYVAVWAALGVLACAWPVWCWRRYGMLAVGEVPASTI